jgi:membrane glycosyltransferase
MDAVTRAEERERYVRLQALWRRAAFFSLTFLTAFAGGFLMLDILRANGLGPLELIGLITFVALFIWIAGAFWTAIAGYFVHLAGHDPAALHPDGDPNRALRGRTAVVLPIYNEDTQRVFAGLDAIWCSLNEQPQVRSFDFFVLSDTRRPEIALKEEQAWRAMVARYGASGRLFYRRRAENLGRKAGNIAEFVRNWGGAYDYMIVLDADSIMSGRALVTMVQMMDDHDNVGIIQALPLLAARETLFARLLQFAVRLNGPLFASGIAFWQLGESNYWGHNAIIRLRAFADHCSLPRLRGSPPFGGEIMSHDIVEAALLRRAGYRTWLVTDISGSWEEVPTNVIDYAARDRRWAQGNLQHVGVMPMRGLHWLSRVHMLTGILSYVTSPMWFLVLVVSSILTSIEAVGGHKYFVPGAHTLFPSWPQYRNGEIIVLLSMTCTILFLPKLLGASLVLADRSLRAAYGGARKLIESVLFEQLMSMLLAPTMMLFHSSFVLSALFGRSVGWDAQPRGDRGITWREGLMRHRWHLLLGLVWGSAILALAPKFIWWMLPVLLGMVIAVPFTVLTSRNSLGRALKQRNLLLTPEETSPPPELAALAANLAKAEAAAETAQRVTTAATVAVATPPPATMSAQPAILTPAPALELFVRVPQHAPLAMASSEAATLALTSRAA